MRDCDIFETRSSLNATRLYTRLYVNGRVGGCVAADRSSTATGGSEAWLLAVAANDVVGHACDFPGGNASELTRFAAAGNRRPFRWAKNDQLSRPDGRNHPTERVSPAEAVKKPHRRCTLRAVSC